MFKKLKNNFLFWLMNTKIYNWMLTSVIPYIRFTTYYALPENKDFQKWGKLMHLGYKELKPGHIILTVDDKKLTSKFIGSFTGEEGFSHAAFCVSKDLSFEIAEMTHTNFTKSTWSDVCYEATRVVILECEDFTEEYIHEMLKLTDSFENTPYDNKFKMGIEALSCSELVYMYDFERKLDVELKPIVGLKPYISPMGLFYAKNCKIVWDSNDQKNNN